MNLIIVGAGKVGENLISNFINEKHNVTVVDIDENRISTISNKYDDVNTVVGSGLERDVLISAGVEKADFIIACTLQDEKNVLCCALAKKIGAKFSIARVRDPELFNEIENMKSILGLDFFFNPELQTAKEIVKVLKYPSAKSVETFCDGKASMLEFTILKDSPLKNKQLIQIKKEFGSEFLFGLIKRDGDAFIPHGDTVINENDTVYLITSENALYNVTKKLQIFKKSAKSVFILGGGKISYYLANALLHSNINVKIVENNEKRAEELSKALSKATVLHFDLTNQDFLEEEKLQDNDACVALTDMDEENVILSLYAKNKGVNKVVGKVDNPSIIKMISDLALDTIVSPKNIISNHIVRFVRARQTKNDNINTFYKLSDDAEALEFTVDESFNYTDISLKDLKIKQNVLIGGVVRNGEFILPDGKTTLILGDKVIVLTIDKQISLLEQIIK